MTLIRKYILNRKVSYALCLYAVVLFFYINIQESFKYFAPTFFFFILPPLYYLAYINYLNKKLGIWLKCFQTIPLLGVAGYWILLIFLIIKKELPDIDDFDGILFFFYLLLLPIAFLEALYSNNQFKFTAILKFFLKKIVWVPIASIVSFAVVWTLIVMVSIGGFQNLKERTILEKEIFLEWLMYKVSGDDKLYCKLESQETVFDFSVVGGFEKFFFNERTYGAWNFFDVPQREALDSRDPGVLKESLKKAKSFLPFFKGDSQAQVQQAYLSYDKENLKGNWCKRSRWLLRAAHQGDEVALGLLTHSGMLHPNLHDSLLKRDISNMDLDNPVVAFEYARRLNGNYNPYDPYDSIEHDVKPDSEALRYIEQSANAGYIPAMHSLKKIYSDDIHFNEKNCSKKIIIHEDLASQKSMFDTYSLMWAYMGRMGSTSGPIYRCLGEKSNFAKSFSLLTNIKSYQDRKTLGYLEALFYLNGWSIKQDYQKAFEIFSESECTNQICNSYYAFMTLKGMGTDQDEELGKNIFIEDLDGVSCDGETFVKSYYSIDDPELKAKEQEKLKINDRVLQCVKNTNKEKLLSIVGGNIRARLSDYYQNDELLATLNVMGEPQ